MLSGPSPRPSLSAPPRPWGRDDNAGVVGAIAPTFVERRTRCCWTCSRRSVLSGPSPRPSLSACPERDGGAGPRRVVGAIAPTFVERATVARSTCACWRCVVGAIAPTFVERRRPCAAPRAARGVLSGPSPRPSLSGALPRGLAPPPAVLSGPSPRPSLSVWSGRTCPAMGGEVLSGPSPRPSLSARPRPASGGRAAGVLSGPSPRPSLSAAAGAAVPRHLRCCRGHRPDLR